MSQVPVRIAFSGLNLLVAGPSSAEIAGLGSSGSGAHHHIGQHFPMLVVQAEQMQDGPPRMRHVADLQKHVKYGWLPQGKTWVGFEIEGFDIRYEGLDVFDRLVVPPPSSVSGCPSDSWDDLGWLVPFSRRYPGAVLKPNWQRNSVVTFHTEIPNGAVIAGHPTDVPDRGIKIYDFGSGIEQAFTDTCIWHTATRSGRVILNCEQRGGPESPITLASRAGEAIECLVFNHPKNPLARMPGWHLGVLHEIFPVSYPELRPASVGRCSHLPHVAEAGEPPNTHEHDPSESVSSPLGEDYCGKSLIYLGLGNGADR